MSFFMTIESVFSITGRGTVATGTVEGGPVSIGDKLFVLHADGRRSETTVKGIERFRRLLTVAEPGEAIGLLLSGVTKEDLLGATVRAELVNEPEPPPLTLEALAFGHAPAIGRPALLLPLRLETAFVGQTLLVRAFPDQVHLDAHDETIRPEEYDLGTAYRAALAAGRPREEARSDLVAALGPARARHIADLADSGPMPAATPTPHNPVTARLLPASLIARAEASGRVFVARGEPINQDLAVSPGPGEADPVNGSLAWMHDFDVAIRNGMALRMRLDQAAASRGIDRLTVFGLSDQSDGVTAFGELLEKHARSSGLALLPPMSETKGASKDSATPHWPAGRQDRDALRVALGLASDVPETLAPPERSAETIQRQLALVLWHALIAPVLGEHYRLSNPADVAELRRFWVDSVRPLGAFPALAIGRQPYSVAPVPDPRRRPGSDSVSRLTAAAATAAPLMAKLAEAARNPQSARTAERAMLDTLQRQPVGQSWRIRPMLSLTAVASVLLGASNPAAAKAAARNASSKMRDLDGLLHLAGLPVPLGNALLGSEDTALVCKALVRDTLDPRKLDDAPVGDPLIGKMLEDNATWRERLAETDRRNPVYDPRAGIEPSQPMPDPEPLLRLLAENAVVRLMSELALAEKIGDEETHRALRDRSDPLQREHWHARQRMAAALEENVTFSNLKSVGAMSVVTPEGLALQADLVELAGALGDLNKSSAKAAHLALAAHLDCLALRFDAVAAGAAIRDLERARKAGASGFEIGAWGVLEDLRPRSDPPRGSYLLAPSERLARVLTLLERAREGLAASGLEDVLEARLMGKDVAAGRRLLSALRDGLAPDHAIARVVSQGLAARGRGDLVPSLIAIFPATGAGPRAADVFDGLAFMKWTPTPLRGIAPADARVIGEEKERVETMLDALSSLLVAEAGGALADRNIDAAKGVLANLSAGGPAPAELAAVTPSVKGTSLDFSLAMFSPNRRQGVSSDAAARLAPRLNRLAQAALVALPGQISILGRSSTFAALGYSALGLATLARPGSDPLARFRAATSARQNVEPASITLDRQAEATLWAAGRLSLCLHESRVLTSDDFPAEAAVDTIDTLLASDVAAARRTLSELFALRPPLVVNLGGSEHIFSGTQPLPIESPQPPVLRASQPNAIGLGVTFSRGPGAVLPTRLTPGQIAATYYELDFIAAPDPELLAAGRAAIQARLDASAAAPDQRAALGALLGDLPALLPLRTSFTLPFQVSRALAGAQPRDLAVWLEEIQCLRRRAAPLSDVLLGQPAALSALQWPAEPNDPGDPTDWIGAPLRRDDVYTGRTSMVATGIQTDLRAGQAFAGLLLDRWSEVVPDYHVDAAIAVSIETPQARAPQAMLLAVPAAPDEAWTPVSLSRTVDFALDLARARAVGLADLPTTWPDEPALAHLAALLPLGAARDTETTLVRTTCPPQIEG